MRFSPSLTLRHSLTFLALLASLLAPAASFAQAGGNLVQDGDFEQALTTHSGGFTPYGQYGNPGSFDPYWTVTQGTVGIDRADTYVYGGQQSLYLTADGNVDGVAQTLATTPGDSYILTFYADSDDPYNYFDVLFGGQTIPFSVSSIQPNGYPDPREKSGVNAAEFTQYSYTVTASSAATSLEFDGASGTTTELDNVSVTPVSPAVPEPSSLAALGLLCLCLGGIMLGARCARCRAIEKWCRNPAIWR